MEELSSDSVLTEQSFHVQRLRRSTHGQKVECRDIIRSPLDYVFLLIMTITQMPLILCQANSSNRLGDGAYMFPFLFLMLVIGLPIIYIEIFLGQYSRKSQLSLWKVSPISNGVFTYLHLIAFAFTIGTGMHGGLLFWYIYEGIRNYNDKYPWNICPMEKSNIICYQNSSVKLTKECKPDRYSIVCPGDKHIQFSETIFYYDSFMGKESVTVVRWSGLITLLVFYLLVLFFLLRKTFYCRMSFVILVCVVLLLVGIILQVLGFPGAKESMGGFLTIDSDHLLKQRVWYRALIDMQQNLCLTSPAVFAYSTCVYFKLKPVFHALTVTFTSLFLTFLVSITSYSILGALATEMNVEISTIQIQEQGIIYSTYLHFLSKLKLNNAYTLLFLVIVALASFNNQVVMMAGLIKSVAMTWKIEGYRTIVAAVYCLTSFLVSIVFFTRLGRLLLPTFERHLLQHSGLVAFLLEAVTVFWLYGTSRLTTDIAFMCGSRPSRFWTVTWQVIPAIALIAITYRLFGYESTWLLIAPKDYIDSMNILAICLFLTVPVMAVRKLVKYAKEHNLSGLFEPTFDWGPINKTLRKTRKLFRPDRDIPSQPLSKYNVDSTNWALVKADIKHNQFHSDRETDDRRNKSERRSLFY